MIMFKFIKELTAVVFQMISGGVNSYRGELNISITASAKSEERLIKSL